MEPYVKEWLYIIDEMDISNTYKYVWGKSIVDICKNEMSSSDIFEISLETIATKFIKYYWDQTSIFELKQGPANTVPTILWLVERLIHKTHEYYGLSRKTSYSEVISCGLIRNEFYKTTVDQIVKMLKKDVCWRFLKVNGQEVQLYKLKNNLDSIVFDKSQKDALSNNSFLLQISLSIKWFIRLVMFNKTYLLSTPFISTAEIYEFNTVLEDWEKKVRKNPFTSNYRDVSQYPVIFSEIMRQIWIGLYLDDWNVSYSSNAKFSQSSLEHEITTKKAFKIYENKNEELIYNYIKSNEENKRKEEDGFDDYFESLLDAILD